MTRVEEAREMLKRYRENSALPIRTIAAGIDVGRTTLSQFLTESYRGNNEEIADKLLQYFERVEESQQAAAVIGEFVETATWRRINEVARVCHAEGDIGLVTGEAGIGKTFAVKEYVARNHGVILIEADATYTVRHLFQELANAVGIQSKGDTHFYLEEVIRKLKNSKRLIIVDESEHLNVKSLDVIRRINDRAGVGILLVGLPAFLHYLRGRKGDYTYLFSRIGVFSEVKNLSRAETEQIIRLNLGEIDASAMKAIQNTVLGNGRRLMKLIRRAERIARINELPITAKVVEEAAKLLVI
jgi:DNA transposition AAA+ family ATPase